MNQHAFSTRRPDLSALRLVALRVAVAAACLTGPVSAGAQTNILVNPGFEQGNTGFLSNYTFRGINNDERQYTVGAQPSAWNQAFVNPPPSSPGSVNMLIVNGGNNPGDDQLSFWYENVTLVPGKRYRLSGRGCTAVVGGPAVVRFRANALALGPAVTLPNVTGVWITFETYWTPPLASVAINLQDLNTATFPNDFYIDDIKMILDTRCQPADIADDAGNPLPSSGSNSGVNEGDYNAFFNSFFTNQSVGSPADIAYDNGDPLPPFGVLGGVNNGVNEGDYNCFFNNFFNGCGG
ncbi:hypothetical protein BH11PLA1_BH11PLA1_12490 [soil metagenome]